MTATARSLGRQAWYWGAIAIAAPFIPAGPLALVLGGALLARTAVRVSRWLAPDDVLVRWPAAWLAVCVEVPILAELLSIGGWLASPAAWLIAQVGADALAAFLLPGAAGGGTPPAAHEAGIWRRALTRSNGLIRSFLLLFAALLAGNLVVAAMSGVTVHDAVTTYVPLCIDAVQSGTLAPPDHDHDWPFPALMTAWHALYIHTMATGNTLACINVLGWLSTTAGFFATVAVCRQAGLSRVLSSVAAAAAFSAPLAVCQAANANFDQQSGFCMALTVYAAMRAWRAPRRSDVTMLALSQVLLAATKLTSAFIAPLVLAIDVAIYLRCGRTGASSSRGRLIVTGCAAAAVLLVPHFWRNQVTYGKLVPETASMSARPDSLSSSTEALVLRHLQLLLPYELAWLGTAPTAAEKGESGDLPLSVDIAQRLSEMGVPISPKFVRAACNHLLDPHDSDKSYLGAIPLLLAALAVLVLLRRRRPHARMSTYVWVFVGMWIVFQLGYAALFRYTPHNGRYMLLAWFLAAPTLGLLIRSLPRWGRSSAVFAAIGIASFEHADWFLHRTHVPLDVVMNQPRSEHFRLAQMPKSNISAVCKRLDDVGVRNLYFDTPRSFRLLYYDAARERRFVYRSLPPFSEDRAILTDLSTPAYDDGTLRTLGERFEIIFIGGEIGGAADRAKAVLLPYVARVRPGTNLVALHVSLRDHAQVELARASRRFEGVHRGPDWRDCYWLRRGPGGRLEFSVAADAARPVIVCLWIGAVEDATCSLELLHDEAVVGGIGSPVTGKLMFRTTLHAGTNAFTLRAASDEKSAEDKLLFISGIEVAAETQMPRQVGIYHYAPANLDARAWVAPLASRAALTTRLEPELAKTVHLIGVQVGREIGDVELPGQAGTVWLGPRGAGEFKIVLRSKAPSMTLMSLAIDKLGVALAADGQCPVKLFVDERCIGSFVADGPGEYRVLLPLSDGTNVVRIRAEADADNDRYGDDARPTMLLLDRVELRRASELGRMAQLDPVVYGPPPIRAQADDAIAAAPARVLGAAPGPLMGRIESGTADSPSCWLGPGNDGRLSLLVESNSDAAAELVFDVRQLGVALADPGRCEVEIGALEGEPSRLLVTHPGVHSVSIRLRAGLNVITLTIPENAGPGRYSNDPRPAMLYVGDFRVAPRRPTSRPVASSFASQ